MQVRVLMIPYNLVCEASLSCTSIFGVELTLRSVWSDHVVRLIGHSQGVCGQIM